MRVHHEQLERRQRLQSKQRLEQQRKDGRIPELWSVGARIRSGEGPLAARIPADRLRYPVIGIQLRKREESFRELGGALAKSEAREPAHDRCILHGPHATEVVLVAV